MTENFSITGSEDWLARLNRTICKLGRAAFEDSLFDLVNAVVQVDHCAVFINNNDGTTAHLFTKSKLDEDICCALAHAYTERFHVRDPNLVVPERQKQERQNTGDIKMTLLPHIPASEYDSAYDEGYKARFFTDTGLIDKVSSLLQTRQYTIYCSFYRLKDSGRFRCGELEELSRILPILTNLIFKHSLLAGRVEKQYVPDLAPDPAPDPIVTRLPLSRSGDAMTGLLDSHNKVFARLTARERQVCLRILQGYTSEAISLDLKVAISTIHTYRKRAYAKLGISSQNELFSLYLEYIPLTG